MKTDYIKTIKVIIAATTMAILLTGCTVGATKSLSFDVLENSVIVSYSGDYSLSKGTEGGHFELLNGDNVELTGFFAKKYIIENYRETLSSANISTSKNSEEELVWSIDGEYNSIKVISDDICVITTSTNKDTEKLNESLSYSVSTISEIVPITPEASTSLKDVSSDDFSEKITEGDITYKSPKGYVDYTESYDDSQSYADNNGNIFITYAFDEVLCPVASNRIF